MQVRTARGVMTRLGAAIVLAIAATVAAMTAGAPVEAQESCPPLPADSFGAHFAWVAGKGTGNTGPVQHAQLPSGVTQINVSAMGGWGGQDAGSFDGGPGGAVDVTFNVPEQSCLDVVVGQYGVDDGGSGWWRGGARGETKGRGKDGSGGGGGTLVAVNGVVLAIAGGGGGSGGNAATHGNGGGMGGAGGHPVADDGQAGRGAFGGDGGAGGGNRGSLGESGSHQNSSSDGAGAGGGGGGGVELGGAKGGIGDDHSGLFGGGGGAGGGDSFLGAGAISPTWHVNPGPCPYPSTPSTCNGSVTVSWLRNSSGLIVPLHPAALPLLPVSQSVPLTPALSPVYPAVSVLPDDLIPDTGPARGRGSAAAVASRKINPVITATVGPSLVQPAPLTFSLYQRRRGKWRLANTFAAQATPANDTNLPVTLPRKVRRAIRRAHRLQSAERLRLDVFDQQTGRRISSHQLTFG
jgi:hypothetical protein